MPSSSHFPDCFTSLGGNQYINSSAIGDYADYILQEVIPQVDKEFRTLASREHRGCFGKSSGGYGAMVHGMKYAAHWGAIANHSGDAYFDFIYRADWPNTLNELGKYTQTPRKAGAYKQGLGTPGDEKLQQGLDDGRVERFLQAVWKKPKLTTAEVHTIMNVCMAATYDPDPEAPLGFPRALPPGDGRVAGGSVAALAAPRPHPHGDAVRAEPAAPQGCLHRLRLARSIPDPLRQPATLAPA